MVNPTPNPSPTLPWKPFESSRSLKCPKTVCPVRSDRLKTYDLASRPSKVFVEELADRWARMRPFRSGLRRFPSNSPERRSVGRRPFLPGRRSKKTMTVGAIGGHVIKTGCALT